MLRPVRDGHAVARRSTTPVSGPDGKGSRDGAGDDDGVVVRLSPEARKALGEAKADDGGDNRKAGAGRDAGPKKLTPDDERVVRQLEARDTQVRAHEAAHQAAARGLGGAASFTY